MLYFLEIIGRLKMICRSDIAKALANPSVFKKVFKKTLDLAYVNRKFNELFSDLFRYVLSHQDDFDRLVKDRSNLLYLAREIPPKFSDLLIQFVLSHPDEFSRLIKSESDLKAMAEQFPHHASIFAKPTVAAALAMVVNESRATSAVFEIAGLLCVLRYEEDSTFYGCVPEVLIRIATFCGNHEHISLDKADKAAVMGYRAHHPLD
jgi:hypothetical protein